MLRLVSEELGDCVGARKHARVLAEFAHAFGHKFRIEAIVIAELLRAKNAP